MELFPSIAEEKIKEALRNGELIGEQLPGFGKPLVPEDLSGIPEELRIGYKLLRNAGFVPEEVQLLNEISGLQELLRHCQTDEASQENRRKLDAASFRFRQLMEDRGVTHTDAYLTYQDKIQDKFG
jgi:ribosomal protein S15P/S13E